MVIKWKKIWQEHKEQMTAAFFLILLCLSLLPVLYIGRYNHPSEDDFQYGATSHLVWEQTHSVMATIREAVSGTISDYTRWQGTYSALFFMRLQPTVFNESWYVMVPVLLIGLLCFSTFYFLNEIIRHWLKGTKSQWISVSSLVIIVSIQLAPVANQAFYWYNGGIFYTGFHSLMLCLLGVISHFLRTGKKRDLILAVLLSAILGGGNYATLLLTILLVATLSVILWVRKRKISGIVISLLVLLVGFAISALAPGNANRALTTGGMGPISAIVSCLLQGFRYLGAWINIWWILVALPMIPIFVSMSKKITYRFSYPGLVMLYSYGLFCAMSCPSFYALGSTGPGRLVDIVYDSFLLFSYGNLFYFIGWAYHKFTRKAEEHNMKIDFIGQWMKKDVTIIGVVFGVVLLFILVCSRGIFDTTTIKAVKSLVKQEAKQYEAEYQVRLSLLKDDTQKQIVFEPYAVQPELLYMEDFEPDPEFWSNQAVALFYGKESVIVRETESVEESNQ